MKYFYLLDLFLNYITHLFWTKFLLSFRTRFWLSLRATEGGMAISLRVYPWTKSRGKISDLYCW